MMNWILYPGEQGCDGFDNDCDQLIDDLDPELELSTASTFYLDQDEDGYGDSLTPIASYEASNGLCG